MSLLHFKNKIYGSKIILEKKKSCIFTEVKKQIEKTGLISANRNNKATLQLTIPGSFKSSTNDLIPTYLKL